MSSSEARKKANKRYAAKTYHRYAVNTRLEYVPKIEEYKAKYGFDSDSGFFNAAAKYVIENDIDVSDEEK